MNQVFRIKGEPTLDKLFGKRNITQVQSITITGNEASITYKTNHEMTLGDIMLYGNDGSEFELLKITDAKTVKAKVIKTGNPTETYCQAHQFEVIRDGLVRVGNMGFRIEKSSGYNYAVLYVFKDHDFVRFPALRQKDAIYIRNDIYVAVGPNLLAFDADYKPATICHSDAGTFFISSNGLYDMDGESLEWNFNYMNIPERLVAAKPSNWKTIITPLYLGHASIPVEAAVAFNIIHISNGIYARRK